MSEVIAESILNFWFGPLDTDGLPSKKEKIEAWWKKDSTFDQSIRNLYGSLMDMAPMGAYDRWSVTPEGRTALIVLLDQFPRNLFRNHARAFYTDEKAQVQTREAIIKGELEKVPLAYAYFMLMPLMHAESLELQDLGLEEFKKLEKRATSEKAKKMMNGAVDFMQQHRDIIAEFGRFPHRNEPMKRKPTEAEIAYLANGGKTF